MIRTNFHKVYKRYLVSSVMKTTLILTLLLAFIVAGCSSQSITTQSVPQNSGTKLSDSPYASYAHLISGDSFDAGTRQALIGFTVDKTVNTNGTTTIVLNATNPEYNTQTYTLQPGQQLYFIERNLGDDAGQERNLGDDAAVIVDAQGYIVQ
jgi:hypothetical protein